MIIRFFTRFYPNVPFIGNRNSIIKTLGDSWSFQGIEASYINHPRKFAEKGDKEKPPSKEEQVTVKIPGLVHPETIKEEGYFTKKAKEQIEDLKKNIDKPTLSDSEKKD